MAKTDKPTKAQRERTKWAKLAELLRLQVGTLPAPQCDVAAELLQLIESEG